MGYDDWIESWCFFKGPDMATKLHLETLGLRAPWRAFCARVTVSSQAQSGTC